MIKRHPLDYDLIRSWDPCYDTAELRDLIDKLHARGVTHFTALDLLNADPELIPLKDQIWLVCAPTTRHEDFLTVDMDKAIVEFVLSKSLPALLANVTDDLTLDRARALWEDQGSGYRVRQWVDTLHGALYEGVPYITPQEARAFLKGLFEGQAKKPEPIPAPVAAPTTTWRDDLRAALEQVRYIARAPGNMQGEKEAEAAVFAIVEGALRANLQGVAKILREGL